MTEPRFLYPNVAKEAENAYQKVKDDSVASSALDDFFNVLGTSIPRTSSGDVDWYKAGNIIGDKVMEMGSGNVSEIVTDRLSILGAGLDAVHKNVPFMGLITGLLSSPKLSPLAGRLLAGFAKL